MKTITIKTRDNAFAKKFVKSIKKEYKEIESVFLAEEPAENYASPGEPMSANTLEKRIGLSENSPLISYKEAEQIIDSWLSRKRK